MTKLDKLILMGVISGAHGIKGDVIVKSFMANVKQISNLRVLDRNFNKIEIKYIRNGANNTAICKIAGCNDRNQAEALIKTELFCLREDMPNLNEEEFYFEDLIGLKVLNLDNCEIGIVTGVFNYGAGDIIEIKLLTSNKKLMLPFTKEYFPIIEKTYIIYHENLQGH